MYNEELKYKNKSQKKNDKTTTIHIENVNTVNIIFGGRQQEDYENYECECGHDHEYNENDDNEDLR